MADEIEFGSPKVKGPSGPVKKGEVVEIKTLIKHPMESGMRKTKEGAPIPANFINEIAVEYLGKPLLKGTWTGAVSKNPYFSFQMKAEATGEVKVTWKDDKGQSWNASATITVG